MKNRRERKAKASEEKPKAIVPPFTLVAWERFIARADKSGKLPPFDLWLGDELRLGGVQSGSRLREQAVAELFAAMRFVELGAFLEEVYRDIAKGYLWKKRSATAGRKFGEWLNSWRSRASDADTGQKRAIEGLKRMGARGSLEWAILRLDAEEAAGRQTLVTPDDSRREFFEVARRVLEDSGDLLALALWNGFPSEFLGALSARVERSAWDEPTVRAFLKAQASMPPLWLRVRSSADETQVRQELSASGLKFKAEGLTLSVRGRAPVQALEASRTGLVEIQDLASQRIGALLDARPGEKVWDACAGEGGKALQILAALSGKGELLATDKLTDKLERLRARAVRAGFVNVKTQLWTGEKPPTGAFDAVLVDAPCSSSGTWRRKPDAKYRFTPLEAAGHFELQLRLLSAAANSVRPGGRLVYGTCSWLVEENENVVSRFLEQNREFELESLSLVGAPGADADTMFAARLLRRRAQ